MTAGRRIKTLSQEWCTPSKIVNAVKEFWGGKIDLDPCSNEYSIVNAEVEYRLPEQNGLEETWNYPTVYVNPPYGRDYERGTTIKDWFVKCAEAKKEFNSQIIALVPVATNTSHWKEYVFNVADAICFLSDSRLHFLENGKDTTKGAPMACCLIYWGGNVENFKQKFKSLGAVVDIREHTQMTLSER